MVFEKLVHCFCQHQTLTLVILGLRWVELLQGVVNPRKFVILISISLEQGFVTFIHHEIWACTTGCFLILWLKKRPQWHQNSEGPMVSIKGSFQALEIGFLVHRPKAKIIPCWKFRAHFWLDEKKTTIWRFQLLLLEPRPNFVEHRKSSSFGIRYESWKVWKVWAASSHLQTFDIAPFPSTALQPSSYSKPSC